MNRRDFLCLRSEGGQRIVTLSCERLFMHYSNSFPVPEPPPQELLGAMPGKLPAANSPAGEDWWAGEPPLEIAATTEEELFLNLGNDLADADVLVLQEREWLQGDRFSGRVKGLLARFRQQGGEVRYWTGESDAPTV